MSFGIPGLGEKDDFAIEKGKRVLLPQKGRKEAALTLELLWCVLP